MRGKSANDLARRVRQTRAQIVRLTDEAFAASLRKDESREALIAFNRIEERRERAKARLERRILALGSELRRPAPAPQLLIALGARTVRGRLMHYPRSRAAEIQAS